MSCLAATPFATRFKYCTTPRWKGLTQPLFKKWQAEHDRIAAALAALSPRRPSANLVEIARTYKTRSERLRSLQYLGGIAPAQIGKIEKVLQNPPVAVAVPPTDVPGSVSTIKSPFPPSVMAPLRVTVGKPVALKLAVTVQFGATE